MRRVNILASWMSGTGWALVSVLLLGGCASSGGSGGSGGTDLRGQPPQVAGQSFTFSGTAHVGGRNSRVFEGEVRFLDHEWYIMEMSQRPCDTRVRRYTPVGDEITVRCAETGVDLTFYLAEGRILGRVEGPVTVRGRERVCMEERKIETSFVCVRWAWVPTETTARGRGQATVERIGSG